ncbi:hypothetical protein ACUNV4_13125 [Granulosicoccus sp. 3-233]|uniref:hypothetical protein n=1 Tax=Granulosicoccus sp. 3-233 TaxID=3417969 RepID=UPI003D33A7B7
MILYLFKYCLPLLLGYTLFIGLAGRMNPFTKPEYPEERPSWFLGIWTGVTVALVLGVGMHMAYSITLESAKALLPSTAFFMGVLSLPGIAGYSLYRRHVSRELREASVAPAAEHQSLKQRVTEDYPWRAYEEASREAGNSDATPIPFATENSDPIGDRNTEEERHAPIVATFLDSAELQVLDTHEHPAANGEPEEAFEAYLGPDFDLDNETSLNDYLDNTVFEEFHYSDLDLDDTQLDATRLIDMSDIAGAQISDAADHEDAELSLFDETAFVQSAEFADYDDDLETEPAIAAMDASDDEFALAEEASSSLQDSPVDASLPQTDVSPTADDADAEAPLEHFEQQQVQETADAHTPVTGSHATSLTSLDLSKRLSEELAAHEETSRQLRITRKVLARLTPSAQDNAATQTADAEDKDSLIRLKEELAASLATQASTLADANSEKERRLQSEEACAHMRQELIQAKQDIRRSSAARAKALSTANKAIAFARQTLQVRALLEEELQMVKNTLSKRQDTISSVIRELENEKERTQEEVACMARQLVSHDRQAILPRTEETQHDELEKNLPTAANDKIAEMHRIGPEL